MNKAIFIFPGLVFLGLVLLWDVISDYNKWKKEIPIKHSGREMIVRVVYLFPSGIMFFLANDEYCFCFTWSTLWFTIKIVFLIGSHYWLLFDGFYNTIRGFDWWFFGTTDDKLGNAFTDKVQLFLGKIMTKVVKIGLVLLFWFLYLKTF